MSAAKQKTKLRWFEASPELLQSMMMLPAGMKIRGCRTGLYGAHRRIRFLIEHPEFEEVEVVDGTPPPVDIQYLSAGKCDICNRPLAISINNFGKGGTNIDPGGLGMTD